MTLAAVVIIVETIIIFAMSWSKKSLLDRESKRLLEEERILKEYIEKLESSLSLLSEEIRDFEQLMDSQHDRWYPEEELADVYKSSSWEHTSREAYIDEHDL